jgi:hypothetical protein
VDHKNGITIARDLIKRYGDQAQAVAEERAALMAQQEPGLSHVWGTVPTMVSELRRTSAGHDHRSTKRAG